MDNQPTWQAPARERLGTPVVGGYTKRAFDIVASLFALVALSPLFVCIATLIWVADGRPIFIRHNRVGLGGQLFPCLKFRTMSVNAEEALARHLACNPSAREEWRLTHKLKHDPRITPFGRYLRELSIDELPQLVNILQGNMSVVGPRPIVMEEIEKYGSSIEYYVSVRPGLTGLWQVSGRSDTTYEARVILDREYVQNWSMRQDIEIIARTVPEVLWARRTY